MKFPARATPSRSLRCHWQNIVWGGRRNASCRRTTAHRGPPRPPSAQPAPPFTPGMETAARPRGGASMRRPLGREVKRALILIWPCQAFELLKMTKRYRGCRTELPRGGGGAHQTGLQRLQSEININAHWFPPMKRMYRSAVRRGGPFLTHPPLPSLNPMSFFLFSSFSSQERKEELFILPKYVRLSRLNGLLRVRARLTASGLMRGDTNALRHGDAWETGGAALSSPRPTSPPPPAGPRRRKGFSSRI